MWMIEFELVNVWVVVIVSAFELVVVIVIVIAFEPVIVWVIVN
jgi:hypothetical protein